MLRRAAAPTGNGQRASVPSVRGGARAGARAGQRDRQELRGASAEFAQRSRHATAKSADQLQQGLATAKSKPPGKGASTQSKSQLRVAKGGEQDARAAERKQRAKAQERAGRTTEAGEGLEAPRSEKLDTRSPIQLKAIDDWSPYLPAPLPDQDDRERKRIEQLVKQKIQGERRQAQQALEQLRAAHLQQARDVRAMKPKLQAQIAQAQRQALGQVASSEASQSAAVRGHVASVQAQVRAHAAAMQAQITSAHAATIAKITATHKAAGDRLTKGKTKALDEVRGAEALALLVLSADFLAVRGRFTALGARKAGDAIAVGEEQSAGMSGRWDGEKLEAAQKAARETADGFATSMSEQAAAALGDIEATRPQAEQSLRDLATSTRDGIGQSFDAAVQALDAAREASVRAADAAKQAALGQLEQSSSSTIASLGAHGAAQVAAIAKQAQGARSGITSAAAAARVGVTKACDQSASGIERGVLGLIRGARQIEAPDPEETKQQVREGAAALERGAKDIGKGLGKSASDAASGLTKQGSSAAKSMAATAAAANAAATQMGNGAKQSMSAIAQGAGESLGELAQAYKTTADEKVKAADKGFTEQVTALNDAFESAATARAGELDKNYSQCESALNQAVPDRGGGSGGSGSGKKEEGGGGESGGAAKDEIASIQENAQKAADAVKPFWQKALAVVVSIVVAVVVVIVVTALVVTTGPVGAILVGAAAGALASVAGSMASNLVLGNDLFEGVTWKSVLLGAVGGGLGAGLTAGLGAGAGALAQSARFAGTSLGRGAQATAAALEGSAATLTQFAVKTGVGVGTDFVSEQAANLIVNGKLDISVESLVLSLVTNAATSHPKFDAFQSTVQSGIQKHTPIRIDLPRAQIQIGNPQASGNGGGTGNGGSADGGGSGGSGGGNRGGSPDVSTRPGDGGGRPQGGDGPTRPNDGGNGGGPPGGRDGAPSTTRPDAGSQTRPPRDGDGGGEPRGPRDEAGGNNDGPRQGGDGDGNASGRDKDAPGGRDKNESPEGGDQNGSREGGGKSEAPGGRDTDAPGGRDTDAPGGRAKDPDATGVDGKDDGPGGGGRDGKKDDAPGGRTKDGDQDAGRGGKKDDAPDDASTPASSPGGKDADEPSARGEDSSDDGSGPDADPAAARDAQLDDVGYPQGTRAKGDELAAKIEQGELPPKDALRDTEANQRGFRDLRELQSDPKLTLEQKAKLQRDLAERLRQEPDPTGDLPRKIEEARAKAKEEPATNEPDPARPDSERSSDPPTTEETSAPRDGDHQPSGGRAQPSHRRDFTEALLTEPNPTPAVKAIQEKYKDANLDSDLTHMDVMRDVNNLRRELVANRSAEIEKVLAQMRRYGADEQRIAEVFDYLFDSQGLAFEYANYHQWSRLASGNGTVDDIRFLLHELHELQTLKADGFEDPLGKSVEGQKGSSEHDQWMNDFFDAYLQAHSGAMRVEAEFVAGEVARLTAGQVSLTPEQCAASDPLRAEEFAENMKVDGVPFREHPEFVALQRGDEPVALSPEVARQLGLPVNTTIANVIVAVKNQRHQ